MTRLPGRTETVIVGAGQAGLAMSWYLQQAGREHVLLDRRRTLGGAWQDRWEQFRLVSPNWSASFPGAPYDGGDPDGFMPRDEIAGRVAGYATAIDAPVVLEAGVRRLGSRASGGFVLDTDQGEVVAGEVIVATGGFHVAHLPPVAAGLSPRVLSLHAQAYRRESELPAGAVLVVGSGQSGGQLVEELRAAGRKVYLCVGSGGRLPRRYRGRDCFEWIHLIAARGADVGVVLPTVGTLPDPRRRLAANPLLSGHDGGHAIDLRRLGAEGTTLLGRLVAIDGDRATFGGNLQGDLDAADRFFEERFRGLFDAFITASGIDAPPAEPWESTDFTPAVIASIDLAASDVSTVLWTTGYRQDLRWVDLPITDDMGFARQVRGVSEVPGLFFIGSLWQHDQTSATLYGMPRDARALAERMGLAPTD